MKFYYLILIGLLVLCSCGENQDIEKTSEKSTESLSTKDSLEQINERLVASPNDANLYSDRAKLLIDRGEINQANSDIDRAISIDSINADFHITRGNINLRMGNVAMAKLSYTRGLEIDPYNINGHLELAKYYLGLTNYDAALEEVDKVLKLDVDNDKAYFFKGRIFLAAKDTTRALSSFQTALELDPDYFESYLLLAVIYADKNDPIALSYYNSALEINPKSYKALYGKGFFEMSSGMDVEAIKTFRLILKDKETDPVPYYNIAYMKMRNAKLDSAIFYYTEAIDRSSDYFQAHFNRGLCYEAIGEEVRAAEDYKMAIALKENYLPAIEALNNLEN